MFKLEKFFKKPAVASTKNEDARIPVMRSFLNKARTTLLITRSFGHKPQPTYIITSPAGGVVSMLAYYSDDSSLNPAEAYRKKS